MYNADDEGVQFRATALFSLQRRRCSIQNGRGVQTRRRIQAVGTVIGRTAAFTDLYYIPYNNLSFLCKYNFL